MFVLTTFIFSCQTNKGSYSNLPQIDIDIAHLESISFKELFNETALIPLATADSTLLGICYPSYTDSCYFMRIPFGQWFGEQYEKLRQSIRQPIQPKKSSGIKL